MTAMADRIQVKRIHDPVECGDGERILVDGMWPRGVRKADAGVDRWLKAVAPSAELRRWFKHDPARWEAFQRAYWGELDDKPDAVESLLASARQGSVTLLFGARDRTHNNAVALKAYLDAHLAGREPIPTPPGHSDDSRG
jgi:uncharacterized protein YeaO (DUF488 family)